MATTTGFGSATLHADPQLIRAVQELAPPGFTYQRADVQAALIRVLNLPPDGQPETHLTTRLDRDAYTAYGTYLTRREHPAQTRPATPGEVIARLIVIGFVVFVTTAVGWGIVIGVDRVFGGSMSPSRTTFWTTTIVLVTAVLAWMIRYRDRTDLFTIDTPPR